MKIYLLGYVLVSSACSTTASVSMLRTQLAAAMPEAKVLPNLSTGSNSVVACDATNADMRLQMLELINNARAEARQCGTEQFQATGPVSWSNQLTLAASQHSDNMAKQNFFAHSGVEGGTLATRVNATSYSWSDLGENIAAGQISAKATVASWLDSAGHCRNLMNPVFTEIGVACSKDEHSEYQRYWTNVLARPR